MNLPPSVRLVDLVPGYPVLEIAHARCRARIALHGAHVMDWQPACQEPVLYLSPDAMFHEGKAIRGGIPVCWPWFNAHPEDPDQPSHGIARTRFWVLEDVREDREGVTVRLSMSQVPWGAELVVHAGEELGLSLKSTNLGNEPIRVSGALHSYLQVADIGKVRIEGLEGTDYLDTVGSPVTRSQKGPLVIDREVDRIYESAGAVRVVDEAAGRAIVIRKSGSPSTVVWNPWIGKAAGLGDLPDTDYRHLVCVEAAIANDKAVMLGQKESAVITTALRVE